MQDKRAEVIPWVCRPPAVVTRRDGRAAGEYGAVGGMPPCEGLSALLAEVEEAGFRRPTGLRPGALHGRPSQGITHPRGDGGGREAAGSRALESDVDIGATWAGVVRVVALRRPVQVLLGCT